MVDDSGSKADSQVIRQVERQDRRKRKLIVDGPSDYHDIYNSSR